MPSCRCHRCLFVVQKKKGELGESNEPAQKNRQIAATFQIHDLENFECAQLFVVDFYLVIQKSMTTSSECLCRCAKMLVKSHTQFHRLHRHCRRRRRRIYFVSSLHKYILTRRLFVSQSMSSNALIVTMLFSVDVASFTLPIIFRYSFPRCA